MRGTQFEEEDNLPRYAGRGRSESFITRLVIKTGLAKDERQAQYILLIVALIVIIAAYLLWSEGSSTPLTAPAVT